MAKVDHRLSGPIYRPTCSGSHGSHLIKIYLEMAALGFLESGNNSL